MARTRTHHCFGTPFKCQTQLVGVLVSRELFFAVCRWQFTAICENWNTRPLDYHDLPELLSCYHSNEQTRYAWLQFQLDEPFFIVTCFVFLLITVLEPLNGARNYAECKTLLKGGKLWLKDLRYQKYVNGQVFDLLLHPSKSPERYITAYSGVTVLAIGCYGFCCRRRW